MRFLRGPPLSCGHLPACYNKTHPAPAARHRFERKILQDWKTSPTRLFQNHNVFSNIYQIHNNSSLKGLSRMFSWYPSDNSPTHISRSCATDLTRVSLLELCLNPIQNTLFRIFPESCYRTCESRWQRFLVSLSENHRCFSREPPPPWGTYLLTKNKILRLRRRARKNAKSSKGFSKVPNISRILPRPLRLLKNPFG